MKLTLGFDADDTLWHNENIFERSHERYRDLLAKYHDRDTVDRTLFGIEMKNLEAYGYGVKGFTLSAIETAIELTDGRISATEIRQLIATGQEMLEHPVDLLDGVADTLGSLHGEHQLVLITKGDLRDQQRKLRKSGLGDLFHHVEILAEKDNHAYRDIFRRHGILPENFLMVGNSLKSDILPVLALGGAGAHIPYHLTWAGEHAQEPTENLHRLYRLERMAELIAVVEGWPAR